MKNLIKEFKADIKEYRFEEKTSAKTQNYAEAAHLHSVIECLEYVVFRMETELNNEK